MTLSKTALGELREILRRSYGADFADGMCDEAIDYLGKFFLEITVQSLKLRVQKHS